MRKSRFTEAQIVGSSTRRHVHLIYGVTNSGKRFDMEIPVHGVVFKTLSDTDLPLCKMLGSIWRIAISQRDRTNKARTQLPPQQHNILARTDDTPERRHDIAKKAIARKLVAI